MRMVGTSRSPRWEHRPAAGRRAAGWRRAARLAPLLAIALFLAACGPYNFNDDVAMTIDPQSDVNQDIFNLYSLVFWLATAVFVVVEAALIFAVFKFRRRPGDRLPRQIHGNNRLELAWTVAPVLLLVLVAIPTVQIIIKHASPPPVDAVRIEVVGRQFWWEVKYPELGITTANEIHIPVGRTAAFDLTSADVQHSFWVPKMAGKMDLFPTRHNTLWFTPRSTGTFFGQCAELCGTAHAYMKMRLMVDSEADFNAWVAGQRQAAAAAAGDQLQQGAQVFVNNGCGGCHYLEGNQNAQGRTGPDLTHAGSRTTIAAGWIDNTPENLARWIRNPAAVKPGVLMPAFERLSAEDMDALVAYLLSLR